MAVFIDRLMAFFQLTHGFTVIEWVILFYFLSYAVLLTRSCCFIDQPRLILYKKLFYRLAKSVLIDWLIYCSFIDLIRVFLWTGLYCFIDWLSFHIDWLILLNRLAFTLFQIVAQLDLIDHGLHGFKTVSGCSCFKD